MKIRFILNIFLICLLSSSAFARRSRVLNRFSKSKRLRNSLTQIGIMYRPYFIMFPYSNNNYASLEEDELFLSKSSFKLFEGDGLG